MTRTVVALFGSIDIALDVVEDLAEAGLPSQSISFAANEPGETYSPCLTGSDNAQLRICPMPPSFP